MVLEHHVDSEGRPSERPLLLAYVNSYFESGVDNPVDEAVLRKARIDPLDSAVLRHEHPDISGYAKVDEVPFDFERRRVSVVVERSDGRLLVTKGAPEHVMAVSSTYESGPSALPLTDEARAHAEATFTALCAEGFRVLAVGYRNLSREHDLFQGGRARSDARWFRRFRRSASRGCSGNVGGDEARGRAGEGPHRRQRSRSPRHVCAAVGLDGARMIAGRRSSSG